MALVKKRKSDKGRNCINEIKPTSPFWKKPLHGFFSYSQISNDGCISCNKNKDSHKNIHVREKLRESFGDRMTGLNFFLPNACHEDNKDTHGTDDGIRCNAKNRKAGLSCGISGF